MGTGGNRGSPQTWYLLYLAYALDGHTAFYLFSSSPSPTPSDVLTHGWDWANVQATWLFLHLNFEHNLLLGSQEFKTCQGPYSQPRLNPGHIRADCPKWHVGLWDSSTTGSHPSNTSPSCLSTAWSLREAATYSGHCVGPPSSAQRNQWVPYSPISVAFLFPTDPACSVLEQSNYKGIIYWALTMCQPLE